MTSFASVQNMILTTDADANKNVSSATYTSTAASASIPVMSYALRKFTIPLNKSTRFYQLYINYSLTPGKWYAFPVVDTFYGTPPTSYLQLATNATQSGENLVVNVYLINAGSATLAVSAFDVSITRRDFVDGA